MTEAAPAGPLDENKVLLDIRGVTKLFPGVVANDAVSFQVLTGEIHCLLGENGAGKTTLADMLYGVYHPDAGAIYLQGEPVKLSSPKDAIRAGIGMVHQHFELVPPMSVIENVIIGTHAKQWLDLGESRRRLQELFSTYGVEIDPDAEVGKLSVGEQQWVEIFKTMYFGVDVLILDEPTAVLTPLGVEQLFRILRQMREDDLTVVMITHKLNEVMAISDRVTVLRRGKVVGTVDTANTTREELAKMMVGREVAFTVDNEGGTPADPVLEVEGIDVAGDSDRSSLKSLSITVRAGEIVGIAGVSGNGQNALFDTLVGVRTPSSGSVRLGGVDISELTAQELASMGVASVPGDRIKQGLMMDFKVKENLILGRHRKPPFSARGLLKKRPIDEFAEASVREYEIKAPSTNHVTRTLSGGNLQKIIMARELSRDHRLLVVHQPTRGLDVAASEYVRLRLIEERDRGSAVLLISEDLDEVLNLSDRIAVISDGAIAGIVDPRSTTPEEIGLLMAGISGADAETDPIPTPPKEISPPIGETSDAEEAGPGPEPAGPTGGDGNADS